MKKLAAGFLHTLGRGEELLCFAAFLLMACCLFADFSLRELLGNGLVWSHQTAVYANILLVMCAIGLASARGAHLRPRFADRLLPQRWEPLVARLAQFVTALVYLFFAWLALQLVWESIQLMERAVVLRILLWPVQALIPLAFFLAFVRHSLYGLFPELHAQTLEADAAGRLDGKGGPGSV